jgi:hypothetical protein
MLERNVGSTSSYSNKHEVVDDKNNHYKSMVMDAIIINHCYSSEGSCVDEEPNVDAAKFFELLIFFDKLLWEIISHCMCLTSSLIMV